MPNLRPSARPLHDAHRFSHTLHIKPPVDLESICIAHDIAEGDILRTCFGLLLAANSARRQVEVVTACPDGIIHVTVERVSLSPDKSLWEMSSLWTREVLTVGEGPSFSADVDTFLKALELPAFTYARAEGEGRARVVSSLFPLSCTVTPAQGALEVILEASAERLSPDELSALAGQFDVLVAAMLRRPSATLEELVRRLPPLRFELTVASNLGLETLTPVLIFWGAEIGMPVSVKAAQLGELPYREPSPDFPSPPGIGATVLLTRPDEWEDGRRQTRMLRPSGVPPDGHNLGYLPNGAPVAEKNRNETRELYEEIFGRREYLRNGLRIVDGATVIDVGANIGLFTLFAHHEAAGVTVHAFEPAPELVSLLRVNTSVYGVEAIVHHAALGADACVAEFTYYPGSTLQSGFHTDVSTDEDVVRQYAHSQASMATRAPLGESALDENLAEGINALMSGRFAAERQTVRVRTLSDVIDEYDIRRIDFLKIDVERAELDVLRGIRQDHWGRIQQLALEVHDVRGRVEHIRKFLHDQGFSLKVEQARLFKGTELFMIYARRPEYLEREDVAAAASHHAALAASAAAWVEQGRGPVYVAVGPATECVTRAGPLDGLQERLAARPDIRFLDLRGSAGELEMVSHPGLDYSPEVGAALGTVLFRRITATIRRPTKALVVDADNVLWGGVCGEVGPANVVIDQSYQRVQDFLVAQKAAGRLLCLCSKNNPADVEEVWETHPEMRLALSDFAAVRVNWKSKAENLLEMSTELGVAPESIVFIDDSPSERAEIAIRVPEVTVVALPENPSQYVEALLGTWALDADALSAEDRLRNEFNKRDRDRRTLARTAATFREYLRQLRLKIRVEDSLPDDVPRITQLAARTTQFNLALNRLSIGDTRRLIAASVVALAVRVEDRFGQYGLVGFLTGVRDEDCLEVSDFFLSCRALGRNVEWAMLRELGRRALAGGMGCVRLQTKRGARNQPAVSFLHHVASHCGTALDAERLTVTVPASALATLDWQAIMPGAAADPPRADAPERSAALARYRWPVAATPSGLLDRLHHVRRGRQELSTPYVPPQGETEAKIARIWRDLLGIEEVGIRDDLLAYGGDSLTAVAICARVQRDLGAVVPVDDFLAQPTVHFLSEQVAAVVPSAAPLATESQAREWDFPSGALEATDGQRRVWAADGASRFRNSQIIPLSYQIEGPLSETRLEAAFAAVIEHNEALRTVLIPTDGKLLQMACEACFKLRRAVAEGASPEVRDARVHDLGEAFFNDPFDLSKDLMLRALLIRVLPHRHVLLVAVHHASADGWSVGLIQRQLSDAYEGSVRPDRLPQYHEYTRWVQAREVLGFFDEGLRAIRSKLPPAGRTPVMPGASERGMRPAAPRFTRFEIPSETNSEVHRLARRIGATPASVFLAVFQLYLAAHSDRNDVTVGYLFANRAEPNHQEIVGFLANMLPIHIEVNWSESVASHIADVGRETFRMLSHSAVPYGLLLRDLLGDAYRFDVTPFEALFTYQSTPSHPLRLGECHVSALEPAWWPVPFEFMLDIEERSDLVTALLRWDGERFAAATVGAFVAAYPTLLRLCCKLAEAPLHTLKEAIQKIASPASARPDREEARGVKGWLLGPVSAPAVGDLLCAVERFADATPNAVASRDGRSSVSYAQLLSIAERIDARLAGAGVEGGDGVVVCMERQPLLLAALLGVMRRGAYFVPRDPSDPPARLKAVVADASPRAIIADDATAGLFSGCRSAILHISADLLGSAGTAPPRHTPRAPQELAYLLYTSGSTGQPKGVEVTHQSLMNYLEWAADAYEVAHGAGSLVHSSIAVDLTLTSLFAPLLAGGTVTMVASDDPADLASALRASEGLSFLKLTPSGLSLLGHLLTAAEVARATRHLILGGEQLTATALKWLADGAAGLPVTNEYGPTETTVGSCAYTFRVGEPVADPVPIGTPIRNTSIAVLGPSGLACPTGVVGEIVIGGAGVTRGYRGRPQETAARFRPDPLGQAGGRCYHTGDLGYVAAAGLLAYKGRADDQVKVHGYRVETAEVEAVLCRFPGVSAAAVVPVKHRTTNLTYLSAFVVAGASASRDISAKLHTWVRTQLPMYARPDRIEVLPHLPLAPGGKVDRKALVARSKVPDDVERVDAGERSDKVEAIARIWQSLLGYGTPGSHDNFFAMGGDSIKALHLVTVARAAGLHLTIRDVLVERTLERIAAAATPLVPEARPRVLAAGELLLTPNQAAFFANARPDPDRWSLRWMFAGPSTIETERLSVALRVLRHMHPALLCRFRKEPGGWSAYLLTESPAESPEVVVLRDLDDRETARQVAQHLSHVEGRLRLDAGATVKLCVFDLGPGRKTTLAWVAHHLVADIVSLEIMSRDLLAAYESGAEVTGVLQDDGYVEWARRAARQGAIVFPSGDRSPECAQLRRAYEAGAAVAGACGTDGQHQRPTVLLLAALMRALSQIHRHSPVRVCAEHNGRARPDLEMEVPSAVGWFTTYRILHVDRLDECSDAALVSLLQLQMAEDGEATRRQALPDVALNFLGTTVSEQDPYLPAQLADAGGVVSGTSLIFGLELVCWIDGPRLLSTWRFDPARFPENDVHRLSDLFGTALSALSDAGDSDGAEPRPWDFPDADLSEADLARILNDWSRS